MPLNCKRKKKSKKFLGLYNFLSKLQFHEICSYFKYHNVIYVILNNNYNINHKPVHAIFEIINKVKNINSFLHNDMIFTLKYHLRVNVGKLKEKKCFEWCCHFNQKFRTKKNNLKYLYIKI